MLKRVGTRLSLILLVVDLGLTALALHLAKLLRLTLPFGACDLGHDLSGPARVRSNTRPTLSG